MFFPSYCIYHPIPEAEFIEKYQRLPFTFCKSLRALLFYFVWNCKVEQYSHEMYIFFQNKPHVGFKEQK